METTPGFRVASVGDASSSSPWITSESSSTLTDRNTKLLENMERLMCAIDCRRQGYSVSPQDAFTPSTLKYLLKLGCACVVLTSAPPYQPRTAVSGHDARELADSSDIDEFCDQLVLFVLEVDSVNGNFDDFGLNENDLGMCLWCINQLNGTSSDTSTTDRTSQPSSSTKRLPTAISLAPATSAQISAALWLLLTTVVAAKLM
ncbi:hypothetical protein PINS_up022580 [Pythium insidiosum]|nr:hypothetical protein PINS_up022580 [Pythium insidiosum]